MDKTFAGGGLMLGIIAGVIFDQGALGILLGLLLGAVAGKAKSQKDGGEA